MGDIARGILTNIVGNITGNLVGDTFSNFGKKK